MRDINEFVIKEPTPATVVIDRACELMLDEPRRVRMETWGEILRDGVKRWAFISYDEPIDVTPACGYVACGAGWLGFVAGIPIGESTGAMISNILTGFKVFEWPSYEDGDENGERRFRAGEALRRFFLSTDLTYDDGQGTPSHAAAAVAALRLVQEEYRDVFESVIIQPIKWEEAR